MRLRLLPILAVLVLGTFGALAHGAGVTTIFTIASSVDGPQGLVAAPDGSLIFADTIGQKIRRLDPNGRITTIAGTGDSDFSGDGGPATRAAFQDPTGLALAPDGSLYVADTDNNRLRKVKPDGTIVTVAGTADQGFSGDNGPAAAAQVNEPRGVAVDSHSRVFFSDSGNNRVRFIDVDGTIHSLAVALKGPTGLAFAADGSLLVADTGDAVIKRIAADGSVKTVAGNGGGGSGGDGGAATSAQLNQPVDVAATPSGGFYIAEQGGHRIRFVDAA